MGSLKFIYILQKKQNIHHQPPQYYCRLMSVMQRLLSQSTLINRLVKTSQHVKAIFSSTTLNVKECSSQLQLRRRHYQWFKWHCSHLKKYFLYICLYPVVTTMQSGGFGENISTGKFEQFLDILKLLGDSFKQQQNNMKNCPVKTSETLKQFMPSLQ